MDSLEPKKLALIRILQILHEHSDETHPLKQEEIANYLEKDYGISVERKAVGRNLSLLKEAGYEIETAKGGSYLKSRLFSDAELRLLIDGVLSSKHVSSAYSTSIMDRLVKLSNKRFKGHVKHIYSVNAWSKTSNEALFSTIDLVDEAIDKERKMIFDYNKYGADKKLRKVSSHTVSPYQLIVKNQHYYLMAYSEKWQDIVFFKLDRITNATILSEKILPIRSLDGYKNGVDYEKISSALPYLYAEDIERVELIVSEIVIDDIIEWFGDGVKIESYQDKYKVTLKVSLRAMEYWALQYLNCVEVLSPSILREKLRIDLKNGITKYEN